MPFTIQGTFAPVFGAGPVGQTQRLAKSQSFTKGHNLPRQVTAGDVRPMFSMAGLRQLQRDVAESKLCLLPRKRKGGAPPSTAHHN